MKIVQEYEEHMIAMQFSVCDCKIDFFFKKKINKTQS